MRPLPVAATTLVLSLALPGCCPGPKELTAGTWARSRTGLEAGALAVLDVDLSQVDRERLRLSPLFIRQQHGWIAARHYLPEEAFREAGTVELAVPLRTEDGKPLMVGHYVLQVFLQGPDEPYPTLAQVDLVVRSCQVY